MTKNNKQILKMKKKPYEIYSTLLCKQLSVLNDI